jgi:hypothetical protein
MIANRFIFGRFAATMSLLVCLILTSGCGSGRPKCIAVSGVVTYRGKPVEGATVMFFPTKSRPASGLTDAKGRFTLQSFSAGDGAVLGSHVVCVNKRIFDPKSPKDTSKATYPKTISVLPDRYATPVQSPLKATVTAEGPNDFSFELSD